MFGGRPKCQNWDTTAELGVHSRSNSRTMALIGFLWYILSRGHVWHGLTRAEEGQAKKFGGPNANYDGAI